MTTLRPELLDELLSHYEKPEDLLGEEGLFKPLKKALLERALGAELGEHLAMRKGIRPGEVRGTPATDILTNSAIPRPRGPTIRRGCTYIPRAVVERTALARKY
jgi:putative transposase